MLYTYLSHLIFIITLLGQYDYLHFTDKEKEGSERLNHLPKITQLVCGSAGMQNSGHQALKCGLLTTALTVSWMPRCMFEELIQAGSGEASWKWWTEPSLGPPESLLTPSPSIPPPCHVLFLTIFLTTLGVQRWWHVSPPHSSSSLAL